jgi:hypothetical protein
MRPHPRLPLGAAVLGLLAIPLALALPGASALASLILALDTPAMVERADAIAVVDVASVSAAWDDEHERIFTTIDLAVVDVWKGPMTPATHVKIVQPGGTVGDVQMKVFGMSLFSPGERALVFLRGTAQAASVLGMAQGKRPLTREAATGRWMVRAPDKAGASFVAPNARANAATGKAPIFETSLRPLEELRAEIRGLVLKAPVK